MTFQTEEEREMEGARAVGELQEIGPRQQCFVRCLRCWMEEPDYQSTIFALAMPELGKAKAQRYLRACEAFMSNLAVSVTRPIARHAVRCPCLGQDEAVLLSVLHHAGIGDRYGATVQAAQLVRQERLGPIVDAAEDLSIAMAGMSVAPDIDLLTTEIPANVSLH
ncbi:MAG: hypothetical protein AAGD13_10480 [Pseudomonadota bacterium]